MIKFGTDGIRGVYGEAVTPEVAFMVGNAIAKQNVKKVLVARDTRISGDTLATSVASGLLAGGVDVVYAGALTSGGVGYLAKKNKFDYGVMLTASHNTPEYNGIKLFAPDGFKTKVDVGQPILLNSKPGKFLQDNKIKKEYINFLKQAFDKEKAGFVKSCALGLAHGAATSVAWEAFNSSGIDISLYGASEDGSKINSEYASVNIKKLGERVVENKLDLGLAFDGDADRVIAVDENGKEVCGDKILYVIAKYFKEIGKLDDKVVGTIVANTGIKHAFRDIGIDFVSTDVGDHHVTAKMKEEGIILGGEKSGHIMMHDKLGAEDGLLAGVVLINAINHFQKSLGELVADIKMFHYKTASVRVKEGAKDKYMESLRFWEFMEMAESYLTRTGRVLIRPSGTEPVVRVLVEGEDEKLCDAVLKEAVSVLESL
ncbi:MAG: phosphoglucosamine mutase [Firmicutes bacterium]|nr:phosphoglucosamine mutase [Bacillota bacterium]